MKNGDFTYIGKGWWIVSENKYLDSDGLIRLVANSINKFSPKVHNHTVSEISDYIVDSELSNYSINPVSNNILKWKFDLIDEYLSNAVLYTEQSLTEEEKAQARKNLGISNQNNSSSTIPSGDVVTTEYTYTYNGDNTSDANSWVSNYGDIKVFVKMGDIPEGTLNLVGATLFRTNPSNQWLDRTFTITEELLNKSLHKSETDIPAVQDGLIQIFDQNSSDFSEFTVLCICTIPGWYNVTFDDWFEVIYFSETGIYGYDKRSYGGNDYLKSFTFSATAEPSGTGGGSSQGGSSVANPIKYQGNEISMFSRGICIGDSVTDGSFDNNQGGAIIKKFSYPSILQRITNVEIVNAGIAGMTSQTWYEASLDSTPHWGTWVNDEWVWHTAPEVSANDVVSTELSYSNFDFAIIHLGINDVGLIGDSTVDEMLENFETNINNIISKLKTSSKGIKIFLATIIPSYANEWNDTYVFMNEKIREIVDNTEDVYLLDLNEYSECATHSAYNITHPTALGYHKIATEIASYISYIISKNLNDFKTVQFIGTEYTV